MFYRKVNLKKNYWNERQIKETKKGEEDIRQNDLRHNQQYIISKPTQNMCIIFKNDKSLVLDILTISLE